MKRVTELVKDERKLLERQARDEALEEAAAKGLSVSPPAAQALSDGEESGRKSTDGGAIPEVPTGPVASVERDGLCVVCQENDATVSRIERFPLPGRARES